MGYKRSDTWNFQEVSLKSQGFLPSSWTVDVKDGTGAAIIDYELNVCVLPQFIC